MNESPYVIHCDGSCYKDSGGLSGWGAVIVEPDGNEKEYSGFIGRKNSQTAELIAVIESIKLTPDGAVVQLYSDSQYVVDWINGRLDDQMRKGKTVHNKKIWLQLRALCTTRDVAFRWEKGHSGIPGNVRANQLARAAVKPYLDKFKADAKAKADTKAIPKSNAFSFPRQAPTQVAT